MREFIVFANPDGTFAVLTIRNPNSEKKVWEYYLPNVGSIRNAEKLVAFLEKEEIDRIEHNRRQKADFQEWVSKPHEFMPAYTGDKLQNCMCGRRLTDEIHILPEAPKIPEIPKAPEAPKFLKKDK